jgi:(1->4)-alpha-D-glucan 1-alpha-D-glucosylmutase
MLGSLETAAPAELLRDWTDGRIKLLLTQRLLRFRREHPLLFQLGAYLPLTVTGAFAESCIAFAREHEGRWIVVLAPRLSARVGFPPIGDAWKDTAVELPGSLARAGATELFTGRELNVDGNPIRLADALAILPFAAFTNQGAAIYKSPTQ